MSAELLRRAAWKMRAEAKAATPGPWRASLGLQVRASQRIVGCWDCCKGSPLDDAEANIEHVASWHPTVALAVADWLEIMALDYAPHWAEPYAAPFVPVIEKAYAVARAYLGDGNT